MNVKMIWYILGKMLGVEALLLLIPAFVGALYGVHDGHCFQIPAAVHNVLLKKNNINYQQINK